MKVFIFSICCLAATFARPDVSHLVHHHNEHLPGQYHIPSTNYGVPQVNHYGVNLHSTSSSHGFVPNYDEHHQHVTYGKDYGYTNYHSPSHVTYDQHVSHGSDQHVGYGNDQHVSYGNDQHYSGEKVEEEKHVYFYSAPDVAENRPRLKVYITPHHKKNTNVLYVKVPEYALPIPEVVAPPSHVDEKTKVYVLVKDAKEYAPVVYNAPPSVKTSHPELYVVPYKNEHDVEKVISEDNHGYSSGSVGVQFDDQSSFVKSINSDSHHIYNDRFSHVQPDSNLNVFARRGSPIANTFVRYDNAGHEVQGRFGDDQTVTSDSLVSHPVDTHVVHHNVQPVDTHVVHHDVHPVDAHVVHHGVHPVESHVVHQDGHHADAHVVHHDVHPVDAHVVHHGVHPVDSHVVHQDGHHADAHVVHHAVHPVDTHVVHHGVHPVDAHVVHHGAQHVDVGGHHEHSLIPNTHVGTHSVHTFGGPALTPVGVLHNSGESETSVTLSPFNSAPLVSGSSVSYSDNSITPGFARVSSPSFVSSTVPTLVHTK